MSANNGDLSGFSLSELFRMEAETQVAILTEGLLALERDPSAMHWLEALMRAAHSLKGAAQIVERRVAVQLTHAMEDYFVAAQKGTVTLPTARIDTLLEGVDLLSRIAQATDSQAKELETQHNIEVEDFVAALSRPLETTDAAKSTPKPTPSTIPIAPAVVETTDETDKLEGTISPLDSTILPQSVETAAPPAPLLPIPPVIPAIASVVPEVSPLPSVSNAPALSAEKNGGKAAETSNRALRVSSDNLNRLMGLAGELMVASRWSESFGSELLRLKRTSQEVAKLLNELQDSLHHTNGNETTIARLTEVRGRQAQTQQLLSERLADLEAFDRRFVGLSSRLYQEVLECRMRPFADGIQGFSRLVRDVARELGKSAQLEIGGEATLVDRDILERIEAPLGHLLRNAVDHGLETPEKRREAGKPEKATIKLEACHTAGMLLIAVSDDGGGIDLESVRRAVVRRQLSSSDVVATMSDAEVLEFLFLPGFSMKEGVTKISGRGVGLDAVQTMVREVGGTVRVSSELGRGTQFQLQLPLTLSVIRTLLVEIGGEPYAFPLARINAALKLRREEIETAQGRQHFTYDGQHIGLVTAHQILELEDSAPQGDMLSVIVLGNKAVRYGVIIDRFLREQELVVRPLDPRLGKVQDISAAALMPDRSPVLIIDVEDLIRSIENLSSGGRVTPSRRSDVEATGHHKRVLVVDDSLTVRELERKLLESRGYQVEIAVDGMDGWNAARTGQYDLVLTDVDMPRMDGIELVKLIKNDGRLQSLPVMIVSYKDREEDRQRGLEAGADYYLTKGSFHDESLLGAVADLIGEAQE